MSENEDDLPPRNRSPLPEIGIVRGPFEDWRHGRYQVLPSTHELVDWLRMMANFLEHEFAANRDIRAPIEEVIVGLNEWDSLKHGDDDCMVAVHQVLYEPAPGTWEAFSACDTLEKALAIAAAHPGRRIVQVTTHRRFVTEPIE